MSREALASSDEQRTRLFHGCRGVALHQERAAGRERRTHSSQMPRRALPSGDSPMSVPASTRNLRLP